MKKKMNLFAACGIVLGALTLSGCEKKEELYKELENYTNGIYSESDYVRIDELLDKLPENYKNVARIKDEYFDMRKYIVQLSQARLSDSESETSRASFKKLTKMQDSNRFWDLSKFFANPNICDSIVYGQYWGQGSDYFYWHDSNRDDYTGEVLSTSLSNEKDATKEYYFFTNYVGELSFGFHNKNDLNDSFMAYSLKFVAYTNDSLYINMTCYKENFTYTLYAI